jgi:hypothetical protein
MGKEKTKVTATVAYETDVVTVEVLKRETRCPHPRCTAILFKGILAAGSYMEIQCRRCKCMTILQVVPTQ